MNALNLAHAVDQTESASIHPDEEPFGMSQDEAKIAQLAQLSLLEYEKCREPEAKNMGGRVSALDNMVNDKRPLSPEPIADDPFEDVDPWPDPVDGARLLSEILTVVNRFCVLPHHSDILMAAWVLHAWTHDAADISPILAFVSPEKRCGKTTALSVIGVLAPKAMHNVNATTSVLFRVIEKFTPTVLIDEGDTYLTYNEELRGILNGGHNRLSAYVWRSVGDNHEPTRFRVWAPKCIAMIGRLPDTLEDRALVVPLRRKQSGESVERFRADKLVEFLPLRRRAKRWVDDNLARLKDMDPHVPGALNDREQDNARPICALADIVGDDWPEMVREALVGLAAQSDDEPQSSGVMLLKDISKALELWTSSRIGSQDLAKALCALEDAPSKESWGGKPISPRGISKLLKPYGVKPRRDRIGSYYWASDFTDAVNRYVAGESSQTATSATTLQTATEESNGVNDRGACGRCGASERWQKGTATNPRKLPQATKEGSDGRG